MFSGCNSLSVCRSYEEVSWDTMLPRHLKAPETTLEIMADPVSERPSTRRYNSRPQLWQVSLGESNIPRCFSRCGRVSTGCCAEAINQLRFSRKQFSSPTLKKNNKRQTVWKWKSLFNQGINVSEVNFLQYFLSSHHVLKLCCSSSICNFCVEQQCAHYVPNAAHLPPVDLLAHTGRYSIETKEGR